MPPHIYSHGYDRKGYQKGHILEVPFAPARQLPSILTRNVGWRKRRRTMKKSKDRRVLVHSVGISSYLNQAIRNCSGWEDFERQFKGLPEKQKGDLFGELVKAYLLLNPEYVTKLKHVWLHPEVPSAVA